MSDFFAPVLLKSHQLPMKNIHIIQKWGCPEIIRFNSTSKNDKIINILNHMHPKHTACQKKKGSIYMGRLLG
jgi:hypothetical protein